MTNKKFIFNKNNVCENPNEIVRMYKQGDWYQPYFIISTAIYNDRWIYGRDIHLIGRGSGEPCMHRPSKRTFSTEAGAINEAVMEMRKFALDNPISTSPNNPDITIVTYPRKFLFMIDEVRKPKIEQLSLF